MSTAPKMPGAHGPRLPSSNAANDWADHARQALGRGRQTQRAADFLRVDRFGQRAADDRVEDAGAERKRDEHDQQQRQAGHERPCGQRNGHERRRPQDEQALGEARRQPADRHALHQHHEHADIGQHQAGALGIQPQAGGGVESEDALERRGRQPEDEADVNQRADARPVERLPQRPRAEGRPRPVRHRRAARRGQRLGQQEEDHDQVDHREQRGGERRHRISPAAQQAADGRPQDEAHPKGRADQPQPLGTVLLVGHVGDIRLRHGDIAARQPIDDAAEEQDADDDLILKVRCCRRSACRLAQPGPAAGSR